MKIAFIVPVFPSLSQTFVLNQITGLIDRGHEVDIFAKISGTEPKIHDDVINYHLLDHTYYFEELLSNKFLRILKAIQIIFSHILIAPSIIIRCLNFFQFGMASVNLSVLYQAILFIRKGPYDIVHCHFGQIGTLGILLRKLGVTKGKIVTTFYGYDLTSYLNINGKDVYKKLLVEADILLPICNYFKEILIEIGCNEKKITIHRIGIDVNKFSPFNNCFPNDNSFRILSIARLVEKKGIENGILAIAKLLKSFPNIQYHIAGDGPLRGTLMDLLDRLGIKNNVHILGWMDQEEILNLISRAQILLAPSVTGKNGDQEGTPVAIMEALASGLPVVSTFHSGIPEIVLNEKTGYLVKEGDVHDLAKKIGKLISNKILLNRMAKEGRKHIVDKFNIDKLNDKLVTIYQNLLE